MQNAALQASIMGAFKKMEQGIKPVQTNEKKDINIKGYGFKELESMYKKGLCPRGNYASGRALSPSAASKFIDSPLEYIRYISQAPFVGSEATEIGNAFEDVLFYGEEAKNYLHVVELPKPTQTMATKANKEAFESALAEYKDKKACITEDGKTLLTSMYKACFHKEWKLTQDIKTYERQIKVERTCEVTGLEMLGYLDFRSQDGKHIIETKTIDDISKAENRMCYAPYAYWIQIAFYSYFADTVTILFVEKKEPHGILRIDFTKEELMKYRLKFENEVAIPFAKALDKGFYKNAADKTKLNIASRLRIK
jgi:hypothetical protein